MHTLPNDLSTLPTVTAADKRALREALREAGVFDRKPARGWLFLLVMAVLGVGTVALMWQQEGVARWALAPLAGLWLTVGAMLGHEGCHKSHAASGPHNALFAAVAFPLLSGLSAAYWSHKHNRLHHAHPNDVVLDPDVNIRPMAGHAEAFEQAGPARRVLHRYLQAWLFWPLASQLHWAMRWSSVKHLWARAQGRDGGRDRVFWLDVFGLAGHVALWVALPSALFGFGLAMLMYQVVWSVVGLYLSAIFAPAHMGLPLMDARQGRELDGWLQQLITTRNIDVPFGLRWAFVGLHHQVEHHLFPRVPHHQLPRAAAIVERWAHERGLPYQRIGLFAGLWDVTCYLARAWREAPASAQVAQQPAPEALPAAS